MALSLTLPSSRPLSLTPLYQLLLFSRPRWPELCWVRSLPCSYTTCLRTFIRHRWAGFFPNSKQLDSQELSFGWGFSSVFTAAWRCQHKPPAPLPPSPIVYLLSAAEALMLAFVLPSRHSRSVFCFTWQLQFDALPLPPPQQQQLARAPA